MQSKKAFKKSLKERDVRAYSPRTSLGIAFINKLTYLKNLNARFFLALTRVSCGSSAIASSSAIRDSS